MKKISIFVIAALILGLKLGIVYGKNSRIKKLGSASYMEREKIIEEILEKRAESIPELIIALKDPDWQIRASVLNILGQMEVKEAVPEITKLLKDNNKIVKISAIWCLGKIKDEGPIPELKEIMLNDPDKDCRMAAAFGLGMLGSKKALPYLKQALTDKEITVRLRASGSLGLLEDDSGYSIVTQEVNNSNVEIRRYAIEALGLIGKKEGVSILKAALNDAHTGIQAGAKVALKEIELKDLSEQKRIDYLENSLKDKQIEIREWAVRLLISQSDKKEVREKLIQATKDKDNPSGKTIENQLKMREIKTD